MATTIVFLSHGVSFFFQDPTTTGYGIKKYGYRSKKLFENSYLGYVTSVPPTPHAYSDVPMFVLNKFVTGNSVPTCEPASRTRPVPEDNEAVTAPNPSLAQPVPQTVPRLRPRSFQVHTSALNLRPRQSCRGPASCHYRASTQPTPLTSLRRGTTEMPRSAKKHVQSKRNLLFII